MSTEEMTAVQKEQQIEFLVPETAATDAPIRTGKPLTGKSQLFTVRMWPEALDDDQVEWRGKVDHVASGEGYAFRDWARLIECLEKMLKGGFRTGHGIG